VQQQAAAAVALDSDMALMAEHMRESAALVLEKNACFLEAATATVEDDVWAVAEDGRKRRRL
jgi:hypothetical protein